MTAKPEKAEWHILTVTRGGTVSLLRNLTEDVARKTMQRLPRPMDDGDPWTDRKIEDRVTSLIEARRRAAESPEQGFIVGGSTGWVYHHCQDGDLETIECFGPEGVEFVVWPKPADYDARYAAALAAAEAQGEIDWGADVGREKEAWS